MPPQIEGSGMSTKLRLSLACGDYEITRPLIDGRVKPAGIELTVITPASRERQPGLKIEKIKPNPTLEDMVVSGELDGLLTPSLPKPFMAGNPNIKRLFDDYRTVEIDYWRKTGIFPIMHVTIIREEIIKQNPWVGPSLARAFDQAKALAYARVRNPRVVPLAWFTSYWEEQLELLGPDPWEYGLGPANRNNLATALRYTHM